MNFKEAIEKELEINPKITYEEASRRIDDLKEKTFNNVRTGWKKNNGNKSPGLDDNGKKSKVCTKSPLKQDIHEVNNNKVDFDIIDDPEILLMDLSMNVLNRQRYTLLKHGVIPSNQWANVLITTRKENIGTSKKEENIRSKFRSMDIKDIANILSIKQKERKTSYINNNEVSLSEVEE